MAGCVLSKTKTRPRNFLKIAKNEPGCFLMHFNPQPGLRLLRLRRLRGRALIPPFSTGVAFYCLRNGHCRILLILTPFSTLCRIILIFTCLGETWRCRTLLKISKQRASSPKMGPCAVVDQRARIKVKDLCIWVLLICHFFLDFGP